MLNANAHLPPPTLEEATRLVELAMRNLAEVAEEVALASAMLNANRLYLARALEALESEGG